MLYSLRYLLSPITLLIAIVSILQGSYYPFIFLLLFDILFITGDVLLGDDNHVLENPSPFILNAALYINFPLLFIFVFLLVSVMGSASPIWIVDAWKNYLNIDIISIKNSMTFIDKCSIMLIAPLFIGAIGTNAGHELTHRKKNKFDMFVGNWLLALSWDCAFAIEHVYGHHKNVGFKEDPATAKRGENIYIYILKSIKNSHADAWKIELSHIRRRKGSVFGFGNKMLRGYMRSLTLTLLSYYIGGVIGLAFFICSSFIGKCILKAIDFIEHYGLVRVKGQPVLPKHSWNSNTLVSCLFTFNLPRHSSHHEKANLKYWELKPYKDAPKLPFGYLATLYIALFLPFVYKRVIKKKLIDWDQNFATSEERELLATYSQY
jgi:alkane 1-monooxygenase